LRNGYRFRAREQGLMAPRKHRRRGTTKPENRRASPRPAAGTSPGREPTSQGGPTQKRYPAWPGSYDAGLRVSWGNFCAPPAGPSRWSLWRRL
jgi:hypothetical protein